MLARKNEKVRTLAHHCFGNKDIDKELMEVPYEDHLGADCNYQ